MAGAGSSDQVTDLTGTGVAGVSSSGQVTDLAGAGVDPAGAEGRAMSCRLSRSRTVVVSCAARKGLGPTIDLSALCAGKG